MKKHTKSTKKSTAKKRNTLVNGQLQYTGTFETDTKFELLTFDAENSGYIETGDAETLFKSLDTNKINWLNVEGLSDTKKISEVCNRLHVPFLWIQDILGNSELPKIEFDDKAVFVLADTFSLQPEQKTVEKEHLAFLLIPNIVVSFQESHLELVDVLRSKIQGNIKNVYSQGPDFLFNLLLSNVVDNYFNVIDALNDESITLEDDLMEFSEATDDMGRSIQKTRKKFMLLRRSIAPLANDFLLLLQNQLPFIDKRNRSYFRDTLDHLRQSVQALDSAHERMSSLVDLYMANNDFRMNKIINRLTIISSIFIPLTFLVGVWGMNFRNMPELTWKYGYLYAWASLLLVAVGVIVWLKRKGWF